MTRDALVVGAGILGCSTARELATRGLHVAVLDREPGPGHGSTSKSSAIVRQRYSHPAAMALALEGLRTWEHWAQSVPADPDGRRARLRQCGVLFVLPAGEPSTGALSAAMSSLGIRVERLDGAALAAAFPSLAFGAEEPVEGLYEPEGGYVDDPARAAADAARAAEAAGVEFHYGIRVAAAMTKWGGDRPAIRGLRDQHGDAYEAPVVVNCSGPHSAAINLLARSPLALNTAPLRQIVVDGTSPALETRGAPVPVIADLALGFYLRPDPTRIRIGAVWPEEETDFLVDPDHDQIVVPASLIEERIARATRRVPALELQEPHGLVGVYDVTPQDWYPIVDKSDTRGYFVAIGTSGAWFKAGPVIGRLAAEMVIAHLSGRDTDVEPLEVTLPLTGHRFPMSLFSRRRPPVALASGGGVLG